MTQDILAHRNKKASKRRFLGKKLEEIVNPFQLACKGKMSTRKAIYFVPVFFCIVTNPFMP
jgi:hypothetical protein